jgi:unsaturated rhamnogalacturonyl hydrolase
MLCLVASIAAGESVQEIAWRVADWQLTHPSEYPLADWTVAPFHNGLVAMGKASGDARFLNAARSIGRELKWKPIRTKYPANDHATIQTFVELYLLDHNPRMLPPSRKQLDRAISTTAKLDADLSFVPKNYRKWSWCDSLYMSPPAFVLMTEATGDRRYLDYTDRNWWKLSDLLYDRDEELMARDLSFVTKREANGQKVFWSRGNGWVFAGLARVLQHMPKDHPSRGRYENQFKEMAARLAGLQQPDGFWHASLLDPASFPRPESSGTGFFVYGFAWGINAGLLDAAKYGPVVDKGWDSLTSAVNAEGKLGWVQVIGDSPVNTTAENTEPYGVGAFLLAASEVLKVSQAPPAK